MFKLPPSWYSTDRNTYTQLFELTFLFNIAIFAAAALLLFLICLILKLCLARRADKQQTRDSILTEEESSRASVVAEQAERPLTSSPSLPHAKSKVFLVFSFLASFFFYCFWVIDSLIYLNFYMFGQLGRSTELDVLSVFVLFLTVAIPALIWKHITKTTPWSEMRREMVVLVLLLVLWLAASIFLVVLAKGGCVCFYNNKYGFKIDDDVEVSTEFTRINSIGVPCPESDICHLYATVPEDPSTSVFFNVHAGIKLQSLKFTLKLNDAIVGTKDAGTLFRMNNVESIGQRNIYSVLFAGLIPNTTYKLEVADKTGGLLKWANYKTVPGADAAELRIASGGDLGLSSNGDRMASYLVQFDPDIVVLGGDIAYDDAMRSCYYSWDTVYYMFEPVYAKMNRLLPIIFSVGNHDVGFDALSTLDIERTTEDLPLFFVFNPQHLAHNQLEVPGIFDRETLHYHKIGPTIHFMLDAGYLRTYKEQVSFIQLHSQNNTNLYRFANYHNPIYPGCTNSNPGSNDRKVIENGLKYWTPAFDELNFVAVMEHHTHFRKITKKIKNDTVSTSGGTRYIGDGSWGVTQIYCPDAKLTPRPELMENYVREDPNHMWQVTLARKNTTAKQYSISYKAINLLNQTVFQLQEDLP